MPWYGDDPEMEQIDQMMQDDDDDFYDSMWTFVGNTDGLEITDWCQACPEAYDGTYFGRQFYFRERRDRWYLMWGEGPAWLVDDEPFDHFDPSGSAKCSKSWKWHPEARGEGERIVAYGAACDLPGNENAGHLKYAIELLALDIARQ